MNKTLSVVIPTFNRALFLDRCLEIHIPLVKDYEIQIFISDNASTDATGAVVAKWAKKYPYLHYHCNATNVGPDKNFEIALKLPQTRYIWLLGDTKYFNREGLSMVLNRAMQNDVDAIIVNDNNRVENIDSQTFKDHNQLLSKLGWHMTQMSSLIFSKELIKNTNFSRYYNTSFIHAGIIFEALSNKEQISIVWLKECTIKGFTLAGVKRISWQDHAFYLWMERWPNFVLSLPPLYTLETKLETIKKHNDYTGLFSMKSLRRLRRKGYYNFTTFMRFRKYFDIAVSNSCRLKFLFPLIIPSAFLKRIFDKVKFFIKERYRSPQNG